MNRETFFNLTLADREELARHLDHLKTRPVSKLHVDELRFRDELLALEKEIGTLFPQ